MLCHLVERGRVCGLCLECRGTYLCKHGINIGLLGHIPLKHLELCVFEQGSNGINATTALRLGYLAVRAQV